ncbi:hypothetical protein [Streptomyces spongiae]|nr:hypothetical protein [Streptomyces spongiae]
MRLHSEKTARELALKKQREEGGERAVKADATTETTATTEAEPVG